MTSLHVTHSQKTTWAKRLILALTVAALVVGLPVTTEVGARSATAQDMMPLDWSNAGLHGYCGISTGNTVEWAQLVLLADGGYGRSGHSSSWDQADGIWGPQSDDAAHEYQRKHGLGVDGCVGPQTWQSMMHGAYTYHQQTHRLFYPANSEPTVSGCTAHQGGFTVCVWEDLRNRFGSANAYFERAGDQWEYWSPRNHNGRCVMWTSSGCG